MMYHKLLFLKIAEASTQIYWVSDGGQKFGEGRAQGREGVDCSW